MWKPLILVMPLVLLAGCATETPPQQPTSWGPPRYSTAPTSLGNFRPDNGGNFRPATGMENSNPNPLPGSWRAN